MQDLLLDTNGDLLIKNGDLVIDDSFYQEVGILLKSAPGEFKSYPLFGVDLAAFVNDETQSITLKSKVKEQLKYDGKTLKTFEIKNEKIVIDAE